MNKSPAVESTAGCETAPGATQLISALERERALEIENAKLRERLARETRLRQSQELESISQLAAGIAHDFNNILTVIQGYTALALSQRNIPGEVAEALGQVSIASERAASLTSQLMNFSRKSTAQPRSLDLNETVQSLGYLLRRLMGDAIAQQFSFAPNLPPVHADPGMIEQIVLHLALNAREAMPSGGKLTIGTAPLLIEPGALMAHPEARPGQFACLTVADTGVGIDASVLNKIFEPFFTTKQSASGLGLSSVYGIVKQHQGWIEVESWPGKGTVFKVLLPAAAPAAAVPVRPQESPSRDGHETILVVEDEPALRELTTRQLRRRGYNVISAGSGAEALEAWREYADSIDLIFTDMGLTDGITGQELGETLLAQKPDLKIIYTSGYTREVVEQDYGMRKDADFLQKPYQPEQMIQVIRTTLDRAGG